MLVSSKWEKQRLEPHSHNIVNVPLPSQQATKILRDLQISCNSSNKRTQVEALQCWEAWISSHSLEDWETDSICHFAMKPLVTKKIYTLHKDSDICKLKLSIMWNLLATVQKKMDLDGPKHILENFLQSCFTWMSSIEHLENVVCVLIIKLLFSLFKSNTDSIACDKYIFAPVEIAGASMEKRFYSVIDKFLDIFENWKKVEDNKLIIKLWTWFLKKCESAHNTIATTVWHRIFKVNQAFCSEKGEPVTERLAFLHACATTVKTVLISSKYIGGESCFMTPCEALFKKLPEICSAEEAEENPDPELFRLCLETSRTLAFKSMEICDYDLCIQFLDSMEDFSLKSFAWGCWCGLVDCFEKSFSSVPHGELKKKEMKFFRKLRSSTVNFELDRHLLDETCVAIVLSNMKILKISCICTTETLNFPSVSNVEYERREFFRESPEEKRISTGNEEAPMDVSFESKALLPVQSSAVASAPTANLINVFDESDKILSVTFDTSGRFSHFDLFFDYPRRTLKLVNLQLDFNLIKNPFGNLKMDGFGFPQNGLNGYRLTSLNKINKLPALLSQSDVSSRCTPLLETAAKVAEDPAGSSFKKGTKPGKSNKRKSREANATVDTTPKRTITTRRTSLNAGKTTETGNVTPRTRRRLKMEMEAKVAEETSETPTKRNRKSFEAIIHEILEKNKIKKTDETHGEHEESTGDKRTLRRRKGKVMSLVNEETPLSKKGKDGKEKKKADISKKSVKEEEKPGKVSTNGKLENFFKVINPPNSDNNECKNVCSPKSETPRKWSKRGKRGSDNMRQISLKTMMKDNEEKVFENKEIKEETEAATDKEIKSTPLKEPHSDHEYAKTCESHQVLLENSNLIESAERRAKRPKNKIPGKTELENIDPNFKELEVPTSDPEKETPMEVDEEVGSQSLKHSKPMAAETIEVNSVSVPECLVPVKEQVIEVESILNKVGECFVPQETESDGILVEEAKTTQNGIASPPISEFMKKDVESERVPEKSDSPEQVPEKSDSLERVPGKSEVPTQIPEKSDIPEQVPEKSDIPEQVPEKSDVLQEKSNTPGQILQGNSSCGQMPEENSALESTKQSDGELNTVLNESLTEEGTRGKKRSFVTADPDDTKCKKMKLTNEIEGSGVATADISSPVKAISQVEVSSPRNKSESASPRTLKMVSRAISSRTSRMIALVPDSVPGSQMGKVESPTQVPHVLNVSPKVDAKDKSRKFIGADRSSRVSKMLASLSKQMVKETEDLGEEDKTSSNLNLTANGNGNCLTAKIISPKSVKKKKFIGFDESKNQTIIYRINTPPSQVLEEWKLLREEYLSSQEAEEAGETEGDSGSLLKTKPVRTWLTKKSRKQIFVPDTEPIIT